MIFEEMLKTHDGRFTLSIYYEYFNQCGSMNGFSPVDKKLEFSLVIEKFSIKK